MELMLELSGLSRQEVLVVKACAATKDFEGVAKVLVDQYSGIHVREGSRSWNGRAFTPQSYGKPGKGYGGSKGSQSSKGSYKTAYNAYLDEEGYREYDEYQEEYFEEAGGIEEHIAEQHTSHSDNPPEAYDFHDEIDEYEATALNALMDLGEGETEDDKSIGEAIQLQLAAFVAFGRVKGKGKRKTKGKRKGYQVQPLHRTAQKATLRDQGQVEMSSLRRLWALGRWPHL